MKIKNIADQGEKPVFIALTDDGKTFYGARAAKDFAEKEPLHCSVCGRDIRVCDCEERIAYMRESTPEVERVSADITDKLINMG